MKYDNTRHMWTKLTILSLLFIAGTVLTPMLAQESCYEQYLREHNMKILTAEDADDSYDELKKTVLAKQLYGDSYLLMVDTVAQRVMITKVDGTYVADVHVALVDSTWYMWLSIDPLADKYPGNTPYMYCNGNPIRFIDPDGREITITGEDGLTITYVPGGKYEGNDSFTKNTYTKLNQLNDMFLNTDFMSSIVNSTDIYNISSIESQVEGTHSFHNGVINIGTTCSIDGIGHELFHAYQETKGQGGASIHNEVEAYLFQTKISFTVFQGSGSTPLTAAERQSSSTFTNALKTLIFDVFNQNAFNAVVSEFKTASNANAGGVYNEYPLVRSNQTQSLIKQFYPIYR